MPARSMGSRLKMALPCKPSRLVSPPCQARSRLSPRPSSTNSTPNTQPMPSRRARSPTVSRLPERAMPRSTSVSRTTSGSSRASSAAEASRYFSRSAFQLSTRSDAGRSATARAVDAFDPIETAGSRRAAPRACARRRRCRGLSPGERGRQPDGRRCGSRALLPPRVECQGRVGRELIAADLEEMPEQRLQPVQPRIDRPAIDLAAMRHGRCRRDRPRSPAASVIRPMVEVEHRRHPERLRASPARRPRPPPDRRGRCVRIGHQLQRIEAGAAAGCQRRQIDHRLPVMRADVDARGLRRHRRAEPCPRHALDRAAVELEVELQACTVGMARQRAAAARRERAAAWRAAAPSLIALPQPLDRLARRRGDRPGPGGLAHPASHRAGRPSDRPR